MRFQFLALALPAVGIASSMAIAVVSVPKAIAQIPSPDSLVAAAASSQQCE